jgi:protease-4
MFLKGALEKLEIEPQIFYAGKFKSATEPLRAYEMTEPNKLQTSVYLNDLYSRILMAAAQKSQSDTGLLHQLANTGAIQTATEAVKYKLIDAVKYDDEVKSEIINLLKIGATDEINYVVLSKYAKSADFAVEGDERLAIIYADGDIVDGKGKEGQIASDDYRNIIRKARLDKKVKGIVFRVNSPGGSALASEEIWREITLAKKDKPVVVSFGDYAASGGYYISCNADSIFAQPNTITGSIGVFGIIPNMKKFFNNKLGITFDGVKTGPFADMPSVDRPLNPAERQFIQNSIDTIYSTFKGRVAQGRKLPIEVVDSIAQGRVWTGQRAIQLGLVDKLGSLTDAIECAARMAKIKSYRLKEYPEKKPWFEKMLNNYTGDVKVKTIKEEIGADQYAIMQQLKSVRNMVNVPQARLPFKIDFR